MWLPPLLTKRLPRRSLGDNWNVDIWGSVWIDPPDKSWVACMVRAQGPNKMNFKSVKMRFEKQESDLISVLSCITWKRKFSAIIHIAWNFKGFQMFYCMAWKPFCEISKLYLLGVKLTMCYVIVLACMKSLQSWTDWWVRVDMEGWGRTRNDVYE